MNLNEYQQLARTTAIYDKSMTMLYPSLGLIGECGEVAEKVKKLFRDDGNVMTQKRKDAIKKELGDCCWYLSNVLSDVDTDLDIVYKMKTSAQTQRVHNMPLPRIVFHMNRCAMAIASLLETWFYDFEANTIEKSRFIGVHHNATKLLVCLSELAERCGFTFEEVYSANIDKLLDRKNRGKLSGDGDSR